MLSTDPSRCAGCRTYEVACSLYKEGLCSPHLSRTRAIKFKETGRKIPTVYSQCRKPQCMVAYPQGGHLWVSQETGAIVINDDIFNGYRSCIGACPRTQMGARFH